MPATKQHDFTHHQGFEQVVPLDGTGPLSVVLVSICELTRPGDQPFQGAASIQIHNVVPEQNAVRGSGDSLVSTPTSGFGSASTGRLPEPAPLKRGATPSTPWRP